MRVGDPRWLVRLALRLAPALDVVEPASLREAVTSSARATLDLYSEGTAEAQDDGVA
jgi:proteasome accessory factor C